jgi:MFS family permease
MSIDAAAEPARGYMWVLRNREMRALLFSDLVSVMGDQLSRVALVVLVYQRTESPLLSSATYAATFLPVVIGAPLLGGLADRLPRRRLMIGGDLIRAGLLGLMAVPGMPIWLLILLMMSAVTVEAPYNAARSPLVREILGDDQGYQLGTSLSETLYISGQIVGFAAAGALLAVFTPSTALLLDALSFLVAALVARAFIVHRPAADVEETEARPDAQPSGPLVRLASAVRRGFLDAKVGFGAAMAPACRRPLLLTWAGVSLAIAPDAVAVPWAHELGIGSVGLGVLLSAGPVGGVVGMLLLGRLPVDRGQRALLPLAVLSLLPLVLAPAAISLPLACVLVFVTGAGLTYSMLARVAFVRGVGDAHRGRAFSIASAGVTAGQGLGIAVVGALASLTAPSVAIALAAGFGLVLVGVIAATSPNPVHLPTEVPEQRLDGDGERGADLDADAAALVAREDEQLVSVGS